MGLGLAIAGAVTSIAATAIGTTMGVVGSVQQQKQSEANAKAQQAQAEYNARLAEREAKALEAESAENARRQHEESKKLLPPIRASAWVTMAPNSAAEKLEPWNTSRPCTMAPPTPVPRVMNTEFFTPADTPATDSARPATVASLSK